MMHYWMIVIPVLVTGYYLGRWWETRKMRSLINKAPVEHKARMEQLGFKLDSCLGYKCSVCGAKFVVEHNICPICNRGSMEKLDVPHE